MIDKDSYSDFKLQSVHLIKACENESYSTGTCFAIGEKHVVTAQHVIEGFNEYYLFSSYDDYKNDNKIKLKLLNAFNDNNLDFSILEVMDEKISLIPIGVCESIPLSKGLNVDLCGYPREKKSHATVTSSITEDLTMLETNKYSFELAKGINVKNYKGMSGSPVLNKGYAIGYLIVQSAGNLLYAISFSDVFKSMQDIKTECGFFIASQEEVNFTSDLCPKTPLRIEYSDDTTHPNIAGLNIGFDFDIWREEELIKSTVDWIIDYALTPIQKKTYEENPNYFEKNETVWNELPELIEKNLPNLLLHIAIRKNYKTIPIVNSVVTLSKSNDFSCSHAIIKNGRLEIWLGVSTFELNLQKAVSEVVEKLQSIINGSAINKRLILINNSIDSRFPFKDRLSVLGNNTLDIHDRVDKIVIPVFISHNSKVISSYNRENFDTKFKEEVLKCKKHFQESYSNSQSIIEIKIFHFPARCTDTLSQNFEDKIIGMKKLFT
ncbi:Hachiman antiphage defense system protein HamA [Vibrio parahaemolyticus]|uniref:Hachiman antiphage defense system protein HamA n=1 Tax=Vibrio parahaemolyticus TaxID=670 RepID=UPI00387B8BBB